MLKRVIVVGASSGIGAALVPRLVRDGFRVGAVARRTALVDQVCRDADPEGERARPYTCDVTDLEASRGAFDRVVEDLGGLDAIVYAAGVMPPRVDGGWTAEDEAQAVQVNLIGAMTWLGTAAERFGAQGHGTLVGIGSVAGDRGRRTHPAYGASKAGLHAYLESLRNLWSTRGVHVLTVKPGPVRTPMIAGKPEPPFVIEASTAADRIGAAMARGIDEIYVPHRWRPIMSVVRAIPSPIFRHLPL